MTLQKIAVLAGTSVGTVSKAFSGGSDVGKETRERILEIARQNGCFEKYYKGPREKKVIAVLCPETESEHYGCLVGLFEQALSLRGADTVVAITRFDADREARLFSELVYRLKIDGMILIGNGAKIKNPDEVPLVILGQRKTGHQNNADYVTTDMSHAIDEAVETLKAYGHRRIGFLGEALTESKMKLFRQSMRRCGLPLYKDYLVTDTARFAKAGEDGMQTLLDRCRGKELPTAIVTAYDQIGYGAMRCALKNGLRVPEDVSFIGIDDISVTDYLGVPLSSICMRHDEVCEQVIDLIFHRIENRHYREWKEIVIPAHLQLRESVCQAFPGGGSQ